VWSSVRVNKAFVCVVVGTGVVLCVCSWFVRVFLVRVFLVRVFLVRVFLVRVFLVRVFLVRVFLVRVFLGTAVVCSVVDGFRGTALGSVRFCVL
jgi:hypothetical protein